MRLILTRHGETVENQEGILQGHMPGNLSELGKLQAKRLALRLKNEKIDEIYSSDLKRAVDTTDEIIKFHPGIPVFYTEKLREGNMGSYTGKYKGEVDFNQKPKDMESWEDMRARSKGFLDSLYRKNPGNCVLFVGHNGINKALISEILGKGPEEIKSIKSQVNTAINIFEIEENGRYKVHLMNSSDHLKSEMPSREKCLEFYKEQNTPENIMKHVLKVNKVAVFLAKKLLEKGEKIDFDLVDKASLLNDLDKWQCINDRSLVHGNITEQILTEKGYPELGYYAKRHIIEFLPKKAGWEEKIIMYSDKRVLNDEIVTLEERFKYINEKYPPRDKEKRMNSIRHSYDVEKEIMEKIDMEPEGLAGHIR